MKKIIILFVILFVAAAIWLLMNRNDHVQPQKAPQQISQETNRKKEQNTVDTETLKSNQISEEDWRKLAERYVTEVKTGSSKDLFIDRMQKVKSMVTSDLYKKLTPAMSEEDIQQSREQNKKLSDKDLIKTNVGSIESASKMIIDDKFEIYVIYTLQVSQSGSMTNARYLMRLKIQIQNGSCQIYEIIEDSELGNGLYK